MEFAVAEYHELAKPQTALMTPEVEWKEKLIARRVKRAVPHTSSLEILGQEYAFHLPTLWPQLYPMRTVAPTDSRCSPVAFLELLTWRSPRGYPSRTPQVSEGDPGCEASNMGHSRRLPTSIGARKST